MNIDAGGPYEEQIPVLTETGRFDGDAFAYLEFLPLTTAKPWVSRWGRSGQSLTLLTEEQPGTTIGYRHKRAHFESIARYPKPARHGR